MYFSKKINYEQKYHLNQSGNRTQNKTYCLPNLRKRFVDEEEIVIAGIASNGSVFAQKIAAALNNISTLKVSLCEVKVDKQNPQLPIQTSLTKGEYENKGLVLVDDVLNSGTTLIYAVRHFLDVPLKKFKTAVLVDRNHKKIPCKG